MIDYRKYGTGKTIVGYLIIIVLTLVVCIASIFVFAFALAPRLSAVWSFSVFLTIPILYALGGIYLYAKTKHNYNLLNEKRQFVFDLCIGIFTYIVIMLLLFSLFLCFLYFPLEKRGINNEPLELHIQFYSIDNNSFLSYKYEDFIKTKEIYSSYNITLQINKPINVEKNINEVDKTSILSQNCTILNELYDLTDKNDRTISVILIDFNGTTLDGMASICGNSNLILMSSNTTISTGWILAHELGHSLNVKIACWKFNLMKEYSHACYGANWVTHDFIRKLQPDFLNQDQVDVMVRTVKEIS